MTYAQSKAEENTKISIPPRGLALAILCALASCSPERVAQQDPPQEPEASQTTAQPVQIELIPYVSRLVTVEVGIGDTVASLILDTGGGVTMISPVVAESIGCTPAGRSVGFRMDGERVEFAHCPGVALSIGGVPFQHEQIGVWDINAILPEGVPPVDGVLSLRTLAQQPFTLELGSRRLTLETPSSLEERVRGMTRLHSRIASGPSGDELTLFLHGTAGAPGWFLVDSGNLDVVQAASHMASPASTNTDSTWEGELTLDGLPPAPSVFRTRDIIYDGALSEEFMSQWTFTFDLRANSVWAAPR